MSNPTLEICALKARVQTRSGATQALAARQEAEAILSGPLPRALGDAARAALSGAGDGIAVIRRLDIAVAHVAGEPRDAAAHRWARAIAASLRGALAEPDLRFADSADQLAYFLVAAKAGRRDDRAAFCPFAGFAAMPAAMAIRAALCRSGAPATEALLRIAPKDRAAILDRLGTEDGALVLRALAGGAATRRLILSLDPAHLARASRFGTAPAAAIWLMLSGQSVGTPTSAPVRAALATHFAERLLAQRRSATENPTSQGSGGAALGAQSDLPRYAGTTPKAAPPLPAELRAALRKRENTRPAQPKQTVLTSPAAGLVLLLPDLAHLCAPLVMETAEKVARLRLGLLCAAGEASRDDPVLRRLCGVASDDTSELDPALAARLLEVEGIDPDGPPMVALSHALLRRFTARIRGFEAISPDYARASFLVVPGKLRETPRLLKLRYAPPPLLVALSMSGCDRGLVRLSWLGEVLLDYAPERTP